MYDPIKIACHEERISSASSNFGQNSIQALVSLQSHFSKQVKINPLCNALFSRESACFAAINGHLKTRKTALLQQQPQIQSPLHEQLTSSPRSPCLYLLDEVLYRKVVTICILAKRSVMLAFIVFALMLRLPALMFSREDYLFRPFMLQRLTSSQPKPCQGVAASYSPQQPQRIHFEARLRRGTAARQQSWSHTRLKCSFRRAGGS